MKFGTVCAYWTKQWSNDDYTGFARKIKSIGFDVMELPAGDLLEMSDEKLAELNALCKELGLTISSNIGPARDKNISDSDPAIRRAGIEYLENIIIQMNKVGSPLLIGAMYNCWPYHFEDLDKPAIWARAVESMKELAAFAKDHGVTLCLEVLNRFETNLLNTCQEGLQFCKDIGYDNVKLLLDTFHMNIEEDSLPQAILDAGDYLGHVHVGEGNRRLPGQGHLPWVEMGEALRKIGYTGAVVMEPFLRDGGQVGKDIKVWRDLSGNADMAGMDKQITESLEFLHRVF